ncbi:MAG TPA: helix-turn-helix domain-containing protein [Pyrinomonadaceae bacterium]
MTKSKERDLIEEEEQLRLDLKRAVVKATLRLSKYHDERRKVIQSDGPISGKDVLRIRKELRVSQKVFARLLNVSIKTVQSWEQGTREPGDAALKLLSIADHYPNILFDLAIESK